MRDIILQTSFNTNVCFSLLSSSRIGLKLSMQREIDYPRYTSAKRVIESKNHR